MNPLQIVNTIANSLGIPSNCSVCNEEWYGLDKNIPKGVCPRCAAKKEVAQTSEQKKQDRATRISNYLKNHKWIIKEPTDAK